MEGFLRYEFGGLIIGGAYFRNFTVFVPATYRGDILCEVICSGRFKTM